MKEVIIRPVRTEDLEIVLELLRSLAAFEGLTQQMRCSMEELHVALFGASPSLYALLAEAAGEPVAVATYSFAFSSFQGRKVLYLEDIYVAEAFRGAGVGRHLMRALAREARSAQCGGMRWLVLDWNQQAIDFYASLGAQSDAAWRPYSISGQAFEDLALAASSVP